jgi:hypothetical protein
MPRRRRKAFLALAVPALLVLAGLAAVQRLTANALTVVNRSGLTLETLDVVLPWQTLRFGRMGDGASRRVSFTIRHDAHIEVRGRLADGQPVRAAEGYLTNGQYGERVCVVIGRQGVVRLSQARRGWDRLLLQGGC